MYMAARTLEQIIAELNPTFQSQTNAVQQQANLIPDQIASQEQGLNAQKDQAYEDILSGARRRGLGFSGIPLAEQAKYNATNYAPALAGLRQQGQQQALSLQQALLGINERRDTLGQQVYQQEQDRDFQAQQAELNRQAAERQARQAAAAQASATYGALSALGNTPSNTLGGGSATIQRTNNGGYNFFDAGGTPINAAQYSVLTGVGYRDLLSKMAKDGDKNAQVALQYVGNDARFGGAPQQYASALGALGATGSYAKNYSIGNGNLNTKLPNAFSALFGGR